LQLCLQHLQQLQLQPAQLQQQSQLLLSRLRLRAAAESLQFSRQLEGRRQLSHGCLTRLSLQLLRLSLPRDVEANLLQTALFTNL
jgi:hypothetical protein